MLNYIVGTYDEVCRVDYGNIILLLLVIYIYIYVHIGSPKKSPRIVIYFICIGSVSMDLLINLKQPKNPNLLKYGFCFYTMYTLYGKKAFIIIFRPSTKACGCKNL